MRLRTAAATLLSLMLGGALLAPASASDGTTSSSDAAVVLAATAQAPTLDERLRDVLPGQSEATAARTTAQTTSLAQRTLDLRAAAARRASRARAAVPRIRMAAPAYGSISASFGSRGHWTTRHTGMDINAHYGDRVHSVLTGRVVKTTYDASYGRVVVVRGAGVDIWYAHLSRDYVRTGQRVRVGQVIGRVGCTGHCTGSHLHIEVRKHDLPTNPATFLWGSHRGKPGDTPAWARLHITTLSAL